VWDVDGSGLREIEDESVAKRIRDKVNDFNAKSAAATLAVTAFYAFVVPEF
jgi:hypothetical protein